MENFKVIRDAFFKNPYALIIVGILGFYLSYRDYKKNYKDSFPSGKSSIIGFMILGITFIILGIITFFK